MAETTGKKVLLFGLGDFARVARVYLDVDSPHEVIGFTVDRQYVDREEFEGLPVFAYEDVLERYPPGEVLVYVALGFRKVNRQRAAIVERVKADGYELLSYVHSSVHRLGGSWRHGEHCFIFEENVIQPFVEIGDDVVLWSGNHIGHDVKIGDHCFISSHVVISGNAVIEPYCFLGVNAAVRNDITIGEGCVIGMGASVTHDCEPDGLYVTKAAQRKRTAASELDDL